jgi:hypothetical protein
MTMNDPTQATAIDPTTNGMNANFSDIDPGKPTNMVLRKVTAISPTQVWYQSHMDGNNPDFAESAKQKSSATGRNFNELIKIIIIDKIENKIIILPKIKSLISSAILTAARKSFIKHNLLHFVSNLGM